MGKTGKIKKRKLAALPTPSGTSSDSEFFGGLLSPSELATATRVLNVLANNSELITSGKTELKGLRGAVFDFQRISSELSGTGALLCTQTRSTAESCVRCRNDPDLEDIGCVEPIEMDRLPCSSFRTAPAKPHAQVSLRHYAQLSTLLTAFL